MIRAKVDRTWFEVFKEDYLRADFVFKGISYPNKYFFKGHRRFFDKIGSRFIYDSGSVELVNYGRGSCQRWVSDEQTKTLKGDLYGS
jgi:hypothetical protein